MPVIWPAPPLEKCSFQLNESANIYSIHICAHECESHHEQLLLHDPVHILCGEVAYRGMNKWPSSAWGNLGCKIGAHGLAWSLLQSSLIVSLFLFPISFPHLSVISLSPSFPFLSLNKLYVQWLLISAPPPPHMANLLKGMFAQSCYSLVKCLKFDSSNLT